MQLLLAQIFGYCLTADISLHKGFLFYGQGSNGKSVVTDVLEALVGPDNCAALQMNDFKERFRIAELSNKLINVSSEVEAHGRVEDAVIKKIISGDPITTERKNKDPIKTKLFSRLIANCNQLPLSRDRSYGWFRRWIILPFKITIPENRCDTELAKRIIKEELPGVLNWALLGLTLLREKRGFSIPKSSNKALEEYKKEIDPTLVFIEDRLEFREDPLEPNRKRKAGTLLDAVYSAYRNWCETNGHKPLSSGNLASVIEKHFKIERVKKTRGKYLPEIFLTTSD